MNEWGGGELLPPQATTPKSVWPVGGPNPGAAPDPDLPPNRVLLNFTLILPLSSEPSIVGWFLLKVLSRLVYFQRWKFHQTLSRHASV